MSYDDPNVLVQRERYIQGGTGAVEVAGRFRHFQEIRLRNLRAWVGTAGTHIAGTGGAYYAVLIGTGAFAAGTSAAAVGTLVYSSNAQGWAGTLALNTTLTASELVRVVKGTAVDATVDMILDYGVDND